MATTGQWMALFPSKHAEKGFTNRQRGVCGLIAVPRKTEAIFSARLFPIPWPMKLRTRRTRARTHKYAVGWAAKSAMSSTAPQQNDAMGQFPAEVSLNSAP
jgi:hypothetical protein